MRSLKRFFWTIVAGALLGAVVLAWFSPQIIIWYYSPPADLAISCKPAVQWAIETYRKVIFTGVLFGVIISGILFFAFNPRRKAQPEVTPTDPAH
jgi:hypothetical protein